MCQAYKYQYSYKVQFQDGGSEVVDVFVCDQCGDVIEQPDTDTGQVYRPGDSMVEGVENASDLC